MRDPRNRVAKVAPWLTLDGDVYPALVDGTVQWVVDGYTSTATYPDSQQLNLHQATSNSLTNATGIASQPNKQVNYLHNSVKAVVDAYTGKVTLYSWNQADQPDPVLQTWESAFPGLVQPESSIPSALLPHLRYPQDLFDVQRSLLTQYHVADPSDFYNGADFWKVPNDPTVAATKTLNGGGVGGSSPTLPSTYMSLSPTGDGAAQWALSSPMVTLNYRELAAFLTVNAQPGPDYGKFTLLDFPAGQSVESPAQIQNDIESDNQIASALTLLRGNSKVVLGNLLTIPLDNKVLYVEPVYTQARGANSFPILRHVIAVYGDGQPAFKPTLNAALRQAIANDARAPLTAPVRGCDHGVHDRARTELRIGGRGVRAVPARVPRRARRRGARLRGPAGPHGSGDRCRHRQGHPRVRAARDRRHRHRSRRRPCCAELRRHVPETVATVQATLRGSAAHPGLRPGLRRSLSALDQARRSLVARRRDARDRRGSSRPSAAQVHLADPEVERGRPGRHEHRTSRTTTLPRRTARRPTARGSGHGTELTRSTCSPTSASR